MNNKHDERKENIQKIKQDIKNTQENVEFANDMIASISDAAAIRELETKNDRRQDAIDSMIDDVKHKIQD